MLTFRKSSRSFARALACALAFALSRALSLCCACGCRCGVDVSVQWNEDKATLFLEKEQEKQDALRAKKEKEDD